MPEALKVAGNDVAEPSTEELEAPKIASGASPAGAPAEKTAATRGRPRGSKNKTPEEKAAAAKAKEQAAKDRDQAKEESHAATVKRQEEKKAAEDAAEDEKNAENEAKGRARQQQLDAQFGKGQSFKTPLKRKVANILFEIGIESDGAAKGVLEEVAEASSTIKDPRSKNMVSYPLAEIVIGVFLATFAGLVSVGKMASFYGKIVPFLIRLNLKNAKFSNGAPCLTGLRRISMHVDADDAYGKLINVFRPKMEHVVKLSDDLGAGGAEGWDPSVLQDEEKALHFCYDILLRGTECYMCVSHMYAPALPLIDRPVPPVPLALAMAAGNGSLAAKVACDAIRTGATYSFKHEMLNPDYRSPSGKKAAADSANSEAKAADSDSGQAKVADSDSSEAKRVEVCLVSDELIKAAPADFANSEVADSDPASSEAANGDSASNEAKNPKYIEVCYISAGPRNIIQSPRFRGVLALDGKASNGSARKRTGVAHVRKLQVMDICDATLGCNVMQVEIEGEKKHETKAVKSALKAMSEKEEFPLEGKVVTFDALNTQRDIVAQIIDGGGGYVAPIKGNHENMLKDIQALVAKHVVFKSENVEFKDCECVFINDDDDDDEKKEKKPKRGSKANKKDSKKDSSEKEDVEQENVKQENVVEENAVQENAENPILPKVFCITTYEARGKARRLKHYILFEREGVEKEIRNLSAWKGCSFIGAERTLTVNWKGDETEVFRYYLTSGMSVSEFSFACRDHWTVENSVHWTMDKVLHDDKCKATNEGGAQFFRAMRTLVSGLVNFYVNTHLVLMKNITSTDLIQDFHDNLVTVAGGGTLVCEITDDMSKKLRETYEDNNAHASLSINNVLGFFYMG
ncbi:MAG: hypothetical protein LBT59_23970 [Clostridiales bacterium]|nr:hypothetical protein [Clostridiales bacterium]